MKMRPYYYGEPKNRIRRFPTDCCALGQLSLNNSHTVEEIKNCLDLIKNETKVNWNFRNRDGGERAIFVITTPNEQELADKLTEVGFELIYWFNRRNGYPEGMLKMWIYSW